MPPTMDENSIDSAKSKLLLSVVLVETILGTTIFLLRTYTKFRITREVGKWSYFWALIAWIGGVLNCIAISLSVSYGLGMHIWELNPEAIVEATKWSWVSDATSRLTGALGRTSGIAFIYELQGKQARRWRKGLLWTIAGYNLSVNVFIAFFMFFRCSPPSYLWDRRIPGGQCPIETFNQYAAYTVASTGGLSDLILVFYPLSIVWGLQMPRRLKAGISIMLSMGLLACFCAAMVTYNLYTIGTTVDPTYVLTPMTIWAVTEMWVILMVVSVPQLRPLLRRISHMMRKKHLPISRASTAMTAEVDSHRSSLRPLQPQNNQIPIYIVAESDRKTSMGHEKATLGDTTQSLSSLSLA